MRNLAATALLAPFLCSLACSGETEDGSGQMGDGGELSSVASGGQESDHAASGGQASGGASPGAGGGPSSAGGGAATGGGSSEPVVLPQKPCPSGSVLRVVDADAGYAEFGSVFSSTPYQRDVANSHNAKPLVFEVSLDEQPVSDCEIRFETAPGHGWLFGNDSLTDDAGQVRAFWTAGDETDHQATATILVGDDATAQSVNLSGSAVPSERTRTGSVHIGYQVPGVWDAIRVQVTPLSGPQSTYISTLNWPGAYGGIQFDENDAGTTKTTKVLFSVWDINASQKAEIIDDGDCNEIHDFGGEGTGTSCRLIFPPSEHGAVPGLPDDYMLRVGDSYETAVEISEVPGCASCSDYHFTFTDVTRGLGPISLGTQRYKQAVTPSSASGFIEDWWDAPGDHCLNSGARTALFHDVAARVGGVWTPIQEATFNPNYVPGNHEICANYAFRAQDGGFLMSSGGDEFVGAPVIGGDSDFGGTPRVTLD